MSEPDFRIGDGCIEAVRYGQKVVGQRVPGHTCSCSTDLSNLTVSEAARWGKLLLGVAHAAPEQLAAEPAPQDETETTG